MTVRRLCCSLIGVAALCLAPIAAAAPATAGSAAHHPLRVINYQPTPALGNAATAGRARRLPTFTSTQTDGGKTFRFTMIGKDPRVHQAKPSTTVPSEIIPLRLVSPGLTPTDPTVGNSCDRTPALTRTLNSPVVKNTTWSFGGTAIGTTQYADAFRRAEFWKFTKPGALNPGYHVTLAFKALPTQTIKVPGADVAESTTSCGTEMIVEINWLKQYLRTKLVPKLASQGLVAPSTFPLFLTTNTVGYDRYVFRCCVLGYHNAYSVSGGIQTYGVADYETSGYLPAAANLHDVETASHEIAEWMDDPLDTNSTMPWGNVGQVSGCQNSLEVADPLTGRTISRKIGTYTYHVQELAFFSWFYHQKSSIGVNGWYSDNGTFKSPAKICS